MPGYCFNSDYFEKETTWAPGVGPGKHEGKQDGLFFFLTAALDAADVKFWCNLNRFNASPLSNRMFSSRTDEISV